MRRGHGTPPRGDGDLVPRTPLPEDPLEEMAGCPADPVVDPALLAARNPRRSLLLGETEAIAHRSDEVASSPGGAVAQFVEQRPHERLEIGNHAVAPTVSTTRSRSLDHPA